MRTLMIGFALLLCALCAPAFAQQDTIVARRDVTLHLTNYLGKSAVKAPIRATYCDAQNVVYRDMVTDEAGAVTLKDIPSVRVIVWGDSVPAVFVEAETDTCSPLHLAKFDRYSVGAIFDFPSNGLTDFFVEDYALGNGRGYDDLIGNPEKGLVYRSIQATPGQKMSACFVMRGKNTSNIAVLDDQYIPFFDGNALQFHSPVTQLSTVPGTMMECHFHYKGHEIPRVSKVQAIPLEISRVIPTGLSYRGDLLALYQPQPIKGGGYQLLLPGPGRYRLSVDLFDETTAPLPGMVVEVPKEGKTVTIELPDPLLKVPPGTDVSWATRPAPFQVKTLTAGVASSGGKTAPVFGPRKGLLAAWYTSPRNMLKVLHGDDGMLYSHPLRRAVINMEQTKVYKIYEMIYPMITLDSEGDNYGRLQGNPLRDLISYTQLKPLANEFPGIWSGRYFLRHDFYDENTDNRCDDMLLPFEIGEGAERGITPKGVPYKESDDCMQSMLREVTLKMPDEIAGMPKYTGDFGLSGNCLLREDNAIGSNNFTVFIGPKGEQTIEISKKTKKLTFICPGLGTMRDIPVPRAVDGKTVITLQGKWEPGVPLSGQLKDADGKAMANTSIYLCTRSNGSQLISETDAEGKFSFENLIPGPVKISCKENVWPLYIPNDGLTGVNLSTGDSIIYIRAGGELWWIPRQGQAISLSNFSIPAGPTGINNQPTPPLCANGLPEQEGAFWQLGGGYGNDCIINHCKIRPWDTVALGESDIAGSFLGLSLPIKNCERLGAIEMSIAGCGKLNGLTIWYHPIRWFPSAELNQYLGQVGPLPPGDYTVTVTTPTGRITRDVTVPEYGVWVDLGKAK